MKLFLSLSILSILVFFSCSKDEPVIDISNSGYPTSVGKIILTNCATAGCHNSQSKDASAGLDLSSWNKMFEGSRSGSVTVPFRHDFSTLFLFTNTHADLGASAEPTMPFNETPLSHAEVLELKNWINAGAFSRTGEIKYSDPTIRKAYAVNQGCDVVTVLDPETGVSMRYVDCGISPSIESPHNVKVSPDGKYWYVSFLGADVLQKFRTSDDQLIGEIPLTGPTDASGGSWNTFVISPDSKKAFCMDFALGRIAVVDLENMTRESTISGFPWIHGSALNSTGDTLYVTSQIGNFIYKIPLNDFSSFEQISLDGTFPNTISGEDPHEVLFSPDGTKYFVTCQGTNEIKVLRTADDLILQTIQVPAFPQEMVVSESLNLLFVSHPEDVNSFAGKRGSVSIIDLSTFNNISVHPGFQPHGMALDEINGRLLVTNRNVNLDGPAPHHSSECGGRNGYMTWIDLTTFEVLEKKIELSTDPYFISIRN